MTSEQTDGSVAGGSSGNAGVWAGGAEPETAKKDKRIDKVHTDTVLNFLLRLACKVS